jgi:site-specific DNA recombinase
MTWAKMKKRAAATKSAAATPRRLRCAIYTRKSITRGLDKEENSLTRQYDYCKAEILRNAHEGWELVDKEYSDGGYSGTDTERPAFQELMADIEAGLVDAVVVYKVDRLSRSLLDFAQIIDVFKQNNCAFVSVTQKFSTADSVGQLVLNVLMSFAEFESKMISDRTKDSIAIARKNGRWTGGHTPYGYRSVDGKLVPDPETASTARFVFLRYEDLRSACIVARELNEAAVRRPRRGDDDDPRLWDKNDVLRMLANPVYAGLIRCDDGLVDGEHEAIVHRDAFERVQAIIARQRPRSSPAPRNAEYLLRGLLRCGGCGAAMTGASSESKGTTYRYYRCSTRDKRGRDACPVRQIPAARAEEAVVAQIGQLAADAPLLEVVTGFCGARLDEAVAALEAQRGELTQQIDDVSARSSRLSAAAGPLSAEDQASLVSSAAELDAARARLQEIDQTLTHAATVRSKTGWIVELVHDFESVWAALTPENRARTVRALVRQVTVDASGTAQIEFVAGDAPLPDALTATGAVA